VSNKCALTKVAWSSEGRRIVVGDVYGRVYIVSIADDVAMPRQDEELRLERLLDEYTTKA
jgi:hypothetical protein